jgi:hypothetical protein
MVGKMHRQRRLNKPSRSWNILFYTELIEDIQKRAEELSVTPSELVRTAVENYLNKNSDTTDTHNVALGKGSFMEGVRAAAEIVRADIPAPRFPSGHTLGDRIANKILDKFE